MLSSCFFREGVTSQQPFAWENNTMNITVADGEVQQYDNLADFSPVDSSSGNCLISLLQNQLLVMQSS